MSSLVVPDGPTVNYPDDIDIVEAKIKTGFMGSKELIIKYKKKGGALTEQMKVAPNTRSNSRGFEFSKW